MLFPGHRLVAANLRPHLDRGVALRIDQRFDRQNPSRTVHGIRVKSKVATHLTVCGNVGRNDRSSGCQCLNDRQPKALDERRGEQGSGVRHQRREASVSEIRGFDHERRQCARPFEYVDDVFIFPTASPCDHQSRRLLSHSLDQPTPDRKQEQEILPRLDRADIQEVRPFAMDRAFSRSSQNALSMPSGTTSILGSRAARSFSDLWTARRDSSELTITSEANFDTVISRLTWRP